MDHENQQQSHIFFFSFFFDKEQQSHIWRKEIDIFFLINQIKFCNFKQSSVDFKLCIQNIKASMPTFRAKFFEKHLTKTFRLFKRSISLHAFQY